jgi:aspartyl-tRNA(Asn)/glutamyl-tRNA(Gln) amidotransferase subunit B
MTRTHPGLKTRLMVGMEVHVELATRSKMWTSAPNVAHRDYFDAPPNSLLDPVVIGMPGTLPVMNKAALEMAMLVGLALHCEIARFSKWDRKSYYYPDLPKNYQLSQYDKPICGEGWLDVPTNAGATQRIRIIRAHLEEDAGKLLHEAPGGFAIDHSIVDLNRAGTPLLEIVTHPDIETPEEAVAFAQALRDICRALGVTEGIMQKGHIRFEPNINVIIEKDGEPGVVYKTPIVEIKNLNSFKAVHGAIAYEYERQVEEWLETGRVMGSRAKSTRGWDDVKGVTTHQRTKEDADEYRYFPDPDLVPVVVSEEWIEKLKLRLPELPEAKRTRYLTTLGLSEKDADQLLGEPKTAAFYDAIVATGVDAKRAAKLLLNTAAKQANERGIAVHELGVTPAQVKAILDLVAASKISSNGADELLAACCEAANGDTSPEELAEARGLLQVSDTGALESFVQAVLADPRNARAVADIKAGKDKAIGSLMGQVMKLSKGQANPQMVTELIKKKV